MTIEKLKDISSALKEVNDKIEALINSVPKEKQTSIEAEYEEILELFDKLDAVLTSASD